MPWWNKKYGKDSICAITHSRLRPGKNSDGLSYCIFLPCKHGFYRSAITNLVISNSEEILKCPLCRQEFDPILVVV
jgi:hypothetical protein